MASLPALEKARELLSKIDNDKKSTDSDIKEALLTSLFNKSLPALQEIAREMRDNKNDVYAPVIQGIFNFWGEMQEVPEPTKVKTLYDRDIVGRLDIVIPDSIRRFIL